MAQNTQLLIDNVTVQEAASQFEIMWLDAQGVPSQANLKKFIAATVIPVIAEGLIQTYSNQQGSMTSSGWVEFNVATIAQSQAKGDQNDTARGVSGNFIKSRVYADTIREVVIQELNIEDYKSGEVAQVFETIIATVIPAIKSEIERAMATETLLLTPTDQLTYSNIDLGDSASYSGTTANNTPPQVLANLNKSIAGIKKLGVKSSASSLNLAVRGGLDRENFIIIASPDMASFIYNSAAYNVRAGDKNLDNYYKGFRSDGDYNGIPVFENPFLTEKANYILYPIGNYAALGFLYTYQGSAMTKKPVSVTQYAYVHEYRFGYGKVAPFDQALFSDIVDITQGSTTKSTVFGTLSLQEPTTTSLIFSGNVVANNIANAAYTLEAYNMGDDANVIASTTVTPDGNGDYAGTVSGLIANSAYQVKLKVTGDWDVNNVASTDQVAYIDWGTFQTKYS